MGSNDLGDGLSVFERQFVKQLDLESEIDQFSNKDVIDGQNEQSIGFHNLIYNYLDDIINVNNIGVNDIFKELQWLNVASSLSLSKDLNGLIVLCDFFTYCCVNCLHILPFLNKFEQNYALKEAIVIGIHSPKFENEKSVENVSDAILRYNIAHPVCNDPELKLWSHLCINCWPTVAILGPNGNLLFVLVGEHAIESKLELYVNTCLEYFRSNNMLNLEKKFALPTKLLKDTIQDNFLYFPSKIVTSPSNSKIAVANSLKHSIIICNTKGQIEHIIGSNKSTIKGLKDGTFDTVLFNSPQGLAWTDNDTIFVCDTENHSIRKIDLINFTVTTFVGNGFIGNDKFGGNFGKDQPLNSPWDMVYDCDNQRIYIAMAGSHQIWVLVLSEKGDNIHGIYYPYASCLCFAGDGNEQKRNNRSLLKSSFAQPSGITMGSNNLFIADSESSSIRMIDLKLNSVSTIVGGSVNPLDLFAFGDKDDIGLKCKLQHCMGVCVDSTTGLIYVADTFNNKIKVICCATKSCETLKINYDNIQDNKKNLNEPNGICICIFNEELNQKFQKVLLVADTNNHRIVSIDISNLQASNFNIYKCEEQIKNIKSSDSLINILNKQIEKQIEITYSNQKIKISLEFCFLGDYKITPNAKHKIKAYMSETVNGIWINFSDIIRSDLNNINFDVIVENNQNEIDALLLIECSLSVCNTKLNCCDFRKIMIEQPFRLKIDKSAIDIEQRVIEKLIKVNI